MNGTTFDALDATKALREAGFGDRQAEAPRLRGGRLAGVVRRAVCADRDTLATKADVVAVRSDLATLRANMRSDLYRALRIQTGAIVGVVIAVVEFL